MSVGFTGEDLGQVSSAPTKPLKLRTATATPMESTGEAQQSQEIMSKVTHEEMSWTRKQLQSGTASPWLFLYMKQATLNKTLFPQGKYNPESLVKANSSLGIWGPQIGEEKSR